MKYMYAVKYLKEVIGRAVLISLDEMSCYARDKRRGRMWLITAVIHLEEGRKVSLVIPAKSRDRETLRKVIDILPRAREYHTDGWRRYEGIFEGKGKHVVHKKSKGYVNLNEGIHSRLRQYSSFLKRKTLAYAKTFSSFIIELFALFWRKGWIPPLFPFRPHNPSLNYTIIPV